MTPKPIPASSLIDVPALRKAIAEAVRGGVEDGMRSRLAACDCPGTSGAHEIGCAALKPAPARLDADATAKPLTEILGNFPPGTKAFYDNAESLVVRPTAITPELMRELSSPCTHDWTIDTPGIGSYCQDCGVECEPGAQHNQRRPTPASAVTPEQDVARRAYLDGWVAENGAELAALRKVAEAARRLVPLLPRMLRGVLYNGAADLDVRPLAESLREALDALPKETT